MAELVPTGQTAFNGAALFQSGEPRDRPGRHRTELPSMGPLFFRAENIAARMGTNNRVPTFNGAALFQSGEHQLTYSINGHERPFNGAALFQSGEHEHVATRGGGREPSMGPLFFRAENVTYRASTDSVAGPLQWGRSFSERRTGPATPPVICRHAFNGAALFQSGELCGGGGGHRVWSFLQWGRSFSERRTRRPGGVPRRGGTFNGAALFQSGERHRSPASLANSATLQWGRSFSERRTGPARVPSAAVPSLQWGRSFSERRTLACSAASGQSTPTFNGAALFQSGELGLLADETRESLPSMGPLFFRAENGG